MKTTEEIIVEFPVNDYDIPQPPKDIAVHVEDL